MMLISINILVYIGTTLLFGFDMNAMEGYLSGGYTAFALTYGHQYWRLITSNFIHFGIIHIACNMISLYNISPFIEKVFGKSRFIIVLIVSGLCTNGLPYLFSRVTNTIPMTISGGASGMILGLVGAICAMSLLYKGPFKRVFESILPSLVLILVISITSSEVSMAGHLGGFVGGFVGSFLIAKLRPRMTWGYYYDPFR